MRSIKQRTCLKKLNFYEWNEIYNVSIPGSKQEKAALQQMAKLAITYEQWEIVYSIAKLCSKLEDLALFKMSVLNYRF